MLKSTPKNITQALAHIFNQSFSTGTFPATFKQSKVIPVFKKGSVTEVNNYRPISLLPVMSKVLERLMYVRLVAFLNQQNFFNKNQFGFRKKHSTSHAAMLLVEEIVKAFEKKQYVLGIFLDLSKAFDTIDHSILLQKLNHFGIRGIAHKWFSSYLKGRTQQVEISNVLSNSKKIELGVPQGSILGPLLFLVYINDFSNSVHAGKSIMLADDTNVFFTSNCYKSLYETANKDLENINNWLVANKLTLNISKTKHVIFRTTNSKTPAHFKLLLRSQEIDRVNTIKFLGLIVHENLSWKPHMQYLLNKLRINYGIIRKASSCLNSKTLLVLYYTMIQSHIMYCICTWCNGNKTLLSNIQRSANKFIRMIFQLDQRASVKSEMQENNILSIDQLMQHETACFMFKYITKALPNAFSNIFHENLIQTNQLDTNNRTSYRTRSNSMFFPTFCRINTTKQSLKYKGPLVWSKVPVHIKEIKSYNSFRKELKQSLTQNK